MNLSGRYLPRQMILHFKNGSKMKILIACLFLFACKSKQKDQIDLLVLGSDTVEIRGATSMNLSKVHDSYGRWINDSVFCTEISPVQLNFSAFAARYKQIEIANDSILSMQMFGGAVPAKTPDIAQRRKTTKYYDSLARTFK